MDFEFAPEQLSRTVVMGGVIGAVAAFLGVSGMGLLDGLPARSAAGIAAVPTLFSGWFFGVVLLFARLQTRTESASPTTMAEKPEPPPK